MGDNSNIHLIPSCPILDSKYYNSLQNMRLWNLYYDKWSGLGVFLVVKIQPDLSFILRLESFSETAFTSYQILIVNEY